MKRIKKILCPIDFSELSDEALEMAIQVAEKNSSILHLIYVLPRPNYYDWTLAGMSNVVLDNYFDKTKKETEGKIKTLADMITKEHPFLELKYEVSDLMDPAMTIINKAKELKADLVVMGSHGRRGLNRVLMGSVAESILRQAPCAVMIYKSKSIPKK